MLLSVLLTFLYIYKLGKETPTRFLIATNKYVYEPSCLSSCSMFDGCYPLDLMTREDSAVPCCFLLV